MKTSYPETKFALLPSKGFGFRRVTKHSYVFSQNLILPSTVPGEPPINGIAHMFKCDITGELRRWGFDRTEKQFFGGDDN